MQFLKIPKTILELDLPANEKMLLAYLSGFDENELHMTNQTISHDLNLSRNQIERGLANLKKAGYIETIGRGKLRRIEMRANPQKRGIDNPQKRGITNTQKRGMPTLKNEGCQPPNLRDDYNIYNIYSNSSYTIPDTIPNTNNRKVECVEHITARANVDSILDKLSRFYPGKFKGMSMNEKKTLVTVWRETFKNESQEDLEAAFLSYTSRAKFFPYPAEFMDEVKSHRQAREFEETWKNQESNSKAEETPEEKEKREKQFADMLEVFTNGE